MTNQSIADVLVALGDPTRQGILQRLLERPQAVGELASTLPVSRPAVSQHLKVLKDVGLVTSRSAGTRRVYAADPDALAALRQHFDAFWKQSLAAFAAALAAEDDEHPPEEEP